MVTEIKVDELLYRERQNAIKDPLDWETRKQINELYNDARQAEIEIEVLKANIEFLEYWTATSMGFALAAVFFVLWVWK